MAKHRDDPRDRYNNELERLELVISDPPEDTDGPGQLRGNVTEADVDAIRELLVALDPKVTGTVFRANGNGRETKESKTLANYTARILDVLLARSAPVRSWATSNRDSV